VDVCERDPGGFLGVVPFVPWEVVVPRLVDHDLRRRQILEGSFRLFAAHGYAALTMRNLAGELGVSTGALYHYFEGKEELFQAMFRQITDRVILEAKTEIGGEDGSAARMEGLGRFLEGRAEDLQQTLLVALDYVRNQRDPASQEFVHTTLADFADALEEELHLPDPHLARSLLSFMLGALVQRALDPQAVDLRAHLQLVAGLAQLAGIGKAPT
jgi:AcrR family transcriptional regulator